LPVQDIAKLVFLAAIWGSSYLMMKGLVPILGPVVTASSRVFVGGGLLLSYCFFKKIPINFKKDFHHFLIVGGVNTAIPFTMYAIAADFVPTSYSVILNATAPLFGALLAWPILQQPIAFKKGLGLFLGLFGVILIAGLHQVQGLQVRTLQGIAACLFAAFCYGLAGIYMGKKTKHIKPVVLAGMGQWTASFLIMPFYPLAPLRGVPDFSLLYYFLMLSVCCSALAYFIYYELVLKHGPAKALTVTYLMPLFGLLWGRIFLGELWYPTMLVGCASILCGVFLVLKSR
jgi:drug/metabolite transporter (DMT)-like permease